MGTKRVSDIVIHMVLLIFGVGLWVSAQGIEVGAAMGQGGDFMPKLCATIWVLLSALLLVSSFIEKKSEKEKSEGSVKGFFATLVLLFVYILLLKPVGFVITSILYMFVQMLLFVPKEQLEKKRIVSFAVISVILPILVNLLFVHVFSLILPAGILK